jgi:hypothetical protein
MRKNSGRVNGLAAVVMALVATLVFAASVTATQHSTRRGPYWGCDGGLCSGANYQITYQVVQGHSEGQSYWAVSRFEMWSSLGAGTKAQAAVIGENPVPHAWLVSYLNASGATVTYSYPPAGSCYSQLNDGTALWWVRCDFYEKDVPLTVVSVRVSFYTDDFTTNGTGWSTSWTQSLN